MQDARITMASEMTSLRAKTRVGRSWMAKLAGAFAITFVIALVIAVVTQVLTTRSFVGTPPLMTSMTARSDAYPRRRLSAKSRKSSKPKSTPKDKKECTFSVTHVPSSELVFNQVGVDGQYGTTRYFPFQAVHSPQNKDLVFNPSDPVVGMFSAQLVTTTPHNALAGLLPEGAEARLGQLQFFFTQEQGMQQLYDSILVEGIGLYPRTGSTFVADSKLTRAIIGGTNKYAGASGQCVSDNMGDAGWVHTFYLDDC
eukprot:g17146.t1